MVRCERPGEGERDGCDGETEDRRRRRQFLKGQTRRSKRLGTVAEVVVGRVGSVRAGTLQPLLRALGHGVSHLKLMATGRTLEEG